MLYIFIAIIIIVSLVFLNWLSYRYFKTKTMKRRKWDLNICCGKTDGGGINADIVKHKNVPNFKLIENIYNLPFSDKQFGDVLCSHTIEHVDDPQKFYNELKRVGKKVTLVTPPLWDIWAAFNPFVHRWIVISFKKEHSQLPIMIPNYAGILWDKMFGQLIQA